MMRKLFVALLVGAVIVSLAAPAFAADLKFTGAYRFRGQFDKALPCFDRTPPAAGAPTECDGNIFDTRFRPRFDVETEGGVRGVLWLEIGDTIFGDSLGSITGTTPNVGRGTGGAIGADAINIETKNAYIDFPVPATPLRLRGGIQPYFTSKNLILEDDGTGLSLYGKLGEVNANFWWLRASVDLDAAGFAARTTSSGIDARDIYGLDLTVSPMRDLNLNAYFIYEHDGTAAADALTGTWFGLAGRGTMQNIRWDLDFVYGTRELATGFDQKGFMLDGGVGMALAGTPWEIELRGWYATGEEDGAGDNDALPAVSSPDIDAGTQLWGGGGTVDFDEPGNASAQNTWGLGVIARWTVSPTLRVTPSIFYIGTLEEGTAAFAPQIGDGALSGLDSVGTEIAVKVDYTLARGLVATLVAAHLLLGDDQSSTGVQFDDATKLAFQVAYGF